jgi:hypothetical protein
VRLGLDRSEIQRMALLRVALADERAGSGALKIGVSRT